MKLLRMRTVSTILFGAVVLAPSHSISCERGELSDFVQSIRDRGAVQGTIERLRGVLAAAAPDAAILEELRRLQIEGYTRDDSLRAQLTAYVENLESLLNSRLPEIECGITSRIATAADMMGATPHPEFLPLLEAIARLEAGSVLPDPRQKAVLAIARTPDPTAMEILIDLLSVDELRPFALVCLRAQTDMVVERGGAETQTMYREWWSEHKHAWKSRRATMFGPLHRFHGNEAEPHDVGNDTPLEEPN